MAAINLKKQDMPPAGGYKKIPFLRNPARTYFNGYQILGGYIGVTAVGLYIYFNAAKEIKKREIEMRSARFAIHPVLMAERDRAYLKEIRRMRDEESELMKNVEGWKVGTWFGERIFKTKPAHEFVDPRFIEFYVNTTYSAFTQRAHLEYYV